MFHLSGRRFIVGVLAIVLAAGALVGTPVWSGTNEEQQVLRDRIQSALSADPMMAQQPIGVSLVGKRVVLQGVVADQKTIDRAIAIVKQVDGVQSVQDNLVVASDNASQSLPPFRDFQSP